MITDLAFTQAYARYAPAIAGYARAVTDGSADAEDVAQDAWLRAWQQRDGLDLPGIVAWLKLVVRRVWWRRLNPFRRDGKRVPAPDIEPFEDKMSEAVDGGQEQVAERVMLYRSIESLTVPWVASNGTAYQRSATDAMKNTLRMVAGSGNVAEVARAQGKTENGVRAMMDRAIAALRQKWRME